MLASENTPCFQAQRSLLLATGQKQSVGRLWDPLQSLIPGQGAEEALRRTVLSGSLDLLQGSEQTP